MPNIIRIMVLGPCLLGSTMLSHPNIGSHSPIYKVFHVPAVLTLNCCV
jgi:hypothetical protein